MPIDDGMSDAELSKMRAFADAELSDAIALLGDANDKANARAAKENYLDIEIPGNANPFVPWADPQIPYQCECGEIIYSDTPHTHQHDGLNRKEGGARRPNRNR